MELVVVNSKSKYKPKDNEIVLNERDFHPCEPFFINHNLEPESFTRIRTKGVLESTKYIRQVLKCFDYLLAVGGEIYIEFFRASFDTPGFPFRPLNFLLNEISLCYTDRFKVNEHVFSNNIDCFLIEKIKPSLLQSDNINSWSFGIVSNGAKNERIIKIINQIIGFNIPKFEILICGPAPTKNLPAFVRIIDDTDLYFDTRIPISRKKNRIIEEALFNNLVIMHDRISFSEKWYDDIKLYGNYFDQLCFPILDENTRKHRVNDWNANYHDFTEFRTGKNKLLKYTEWDRHIFNDGGFMLIKRNILLKNRLNPYLNWNEMEDVDLSNRLYLDGVLVNFYQNTYLLTQTHRHNVSNKVSIQEKIKNKLFGEMINYLSKINIQNKFNYFINDRFFQQ